MQCCTSKIMWGKMTKPKNKRTNKEYEELGRRLDNIYLTGYIDRKEMLRMSFLRGMATGLGGVIGATIVVTLLLWALSLFDTVWFIGPIANNVKNTIQSQTDK